MYRAPDREADGGLAGADAGGYLKSTFESAYYNYSGFAGMLGRAVLYGRLCHVWAHGTTRDCTITRYMHIKKSVKAEEA